MGNRVWKNSSVNGESKYIVDIAGGLPVILMELDQNEDIVKSYIYENAQIIAQRTGGQSASKYFYVNDRLGSVRQVIDMYGSVERNYTYSPFGQVLEEGGSFANNFMFTGQWFDDEISQYYLRARMYDPVLMRFTSRDPVKGKFRNPLTLHKYLYCGNDPINRTDPDGRFFGLANLLFSRAMESQLRKMDYIFHMDILRMAEGKLDAFSIMNLQRGITMDLFAASMQSDLAGTVRDAGIEALGIFSPNLERLAGFLAEGFDKRKTILEILRGNKELSDFIGEELAETIASEMID